MRHLIVKLGTCALFVAAAAQGSAATGAPTFPLNKSAQFNASVGLSVVSLDGTQPYVAQVGTTGVGGVRVSYDKIRGTYSVSDIADGYSASGLRRSTATGIYNVYSKLSNTIVDQLKLYNAGRAGISAVPLSYVSFGFWSHSNTSSGDTRKYALVFGSQTPESNIPRSGTASYRTMVNGSSTLIGTDGGTRDVGGTASFDVDFSNASVSTQLNLAYVAKGSQTPIGTFSGSGAIYSNQFGGSLTSNTPYFVWGGFAGGFYGPTAQEMGYSFGIYRHNADPYAGATVNFLDESIVGSVVGTRNK